MKTGVLFWGFKDINITAECAKILKKSNNIRDVYVQLSTHEKTVSLLDIFPEEIIRCEHEDLYSLLAWLQKNERKNIIIVIDFWSFLSSRNFLDKLNNFKSILKMPFQFIIYLPKYYHELTLRKKNMKLNSILEKTDDLFSKVRAIYELSLNSASSVTMLASAPNISYLNRLCRQEFFMKKEVWFINYVPYLLKNYPSSYLSNKKFIDDLVSKIYEINEGIQLYKNRDFISNFRNEINSDILNKHFKDNKNNNKLFNFVFTSSIDRFYNAKTKEENRVLLWCIYLGIIEYTFKYSETSIEDSKSIEMIFSHISV